MYFHEHVRTDYRGEHGRWTSQARFAHLPKGITFSLCFALLALPAFHCLTAILPHHPFGPHHTNNTTTKVLDHWGGAIGPDEVVCVGDSLNRDVLGAKWIGMRSILVRAQDTMQRHLNPMGLERKHLSLPGNARA
jgi:hypothetical protein